jgi:mRNA interferase RelE/StbE
MPYKIEIRPRALKFLKTIPSSDKERIEKKIEELSNNPRNESVIKLSGKDPEQYRARQGNYRIVFSICDLKLIVEVIEIDHRKDVYKK